MTAPTHVDNVIDYLKWSTAGLSQLAAILKTIEDEAREHPRLLALAGAGRHIADDMQNMVGCWHEEVQEKGIRAD